MILLKLMLRTIDRLSLIVGYSVAVLVPLMILSLVYEVISRYFFHAPTLWAQDVSIFLFGYIGLLGGAFVMQERAHINVDLIYSRLSLRGRAICDVISGLVMMFFLILVVVYAWHEGKRAIMLGLRRPTDWAPPLGHFILAISIGGFLLLLQTFAHWIRHLHMAVTGRPLEPLADHQPEITETRV